MRKTFTRLNVLLTVLLATLSCTLSDVMKRQPQDSDIRTAVLTEDDVPANFERLSEEELSAQGLTGEELTAGFKLQNATGQNISAFIYDEDEQFGLILGMVIYPLNRVEALSMDVELFFNDLSDKDYANEMVESFGLDAALMPEAINIGDKSMGVRYTPRDLAMVDGRGEIVLFRQRNALGMVMVSYLPQTPIDAVELAEILNHKLEDTLE